MKQGAQVFNSIILHDGEIGAGAVLNRAILDKRVVVGDRAQIAGLSTVPNREFRPTCPKGLRWSGKRPRFPPAKSFREIACFFPICNPSDYPARVIEAGMTIRNKEEG